MTDAADLVLKNAEVHTLAAPGYDPGPAATDPPDETAEAVAVRDGEIVRVDDDYEVDFLVDVETEVLDLDRRVLLPGFIDAHTHLESTGQHVVHADLSTASSVDEAVELLREGARDDREWIQGFGWDESDWAAGRYLRAGDLDRVSDDRPVVAFRVDMHTAALNSVALDRLAEDLPDGEMAFEGGDPTGVVVEDAVDVVRAAIDRDADATRELVTAARDRCHERGVTCVHEKVRDSHAPRVYRDLAAAGELGMRVRIDYWSDHLDAVLETGLRTNAGGDRVHVGGIKTFTDGSFGGRTAR
ncbi:MAG: amidohydrolase family protein, partial [Halobacteriales archaeon]